MSAWAQLSFWTVVIGILALAILAGRRTRRDPVDFYLSSRSQPLWRSAIASFAAAESGFVFLGLVGTAYTQGVVVLWILVGVIYGYLGTWLYMAPRLRRITEANDVLTVPQVIGLAAGTTRPFVVAYSATLLTLALLMYVAVQFYAIGKTLHFITGWPIWVGAVIGALFIVTYTSVGGLRSISNADVTQGCMMVGSLVMMGVSVGMALRRGSGSLIAQLDSISTSLADPFSGFSGWAAAGQVFFYSVIGLGLTGAPHYLRKFMATKRTVSQQRAGYIATASVLVMFSSALFTGLAGRVLLSGVTDSETVILVFGNKLFRGVTGILFGILVAGIFSAIGSTADSQLLEAAATLTEDGATLGIPKTVSSSPRRTIIILGLVGLLLSLVGSESVFSRTLVAWSLLGATFGPQLLFVLSDARVTGRSIFFGMITASVTVLAWEFLTPWAHTVYSIAPGFLLGGLTTMMISQLSPRENDDKLTLA